MANYNLNEKLKAKAAARANEAKDGEVKLDDVTRVKVLSPGRRVFKRFIRNRLAVFGSVLLIIMFLLSFLGPVFYPYGQKQTFYRYNSQNVNYAQIKDNTVFNGYVINDTVEVNTHVNSNVTTNIKAMLANGDTVRYLRGEDAIYAITRLSDDTYTLSRTEESTEIAGFGLAEYTVGEYDTILNKLVPAKGVTADPDLAAALKPVVKQAPGSVEVNGQTYTFERGKGKSYVVKTKSDGFRYIEDPIGPEFEELAQKTVDAGSTAFQLNGVDYAVLTKGTAHTVFAVSGGKAAKLFTTLNIDTYEKAVKISEEFRINALLALYGSGTFNADGKSYTVEMDADGLAVIRNADGTEFGEFTSLVMRRYNGEDTMSYDLKKKLAEAIEAMVARGEKNCDVDYQLPMQNEDSTYVYDENGVLQYAPAVLHVTQRDTGNWVVNCDQTVYVIDIHAAPSVKHILGTDSDGYDTFARIMYGGRISLMVGFVVVFLETLLGVIMGGLAGYYGGAVDFTIMRLVDIFYCLPGMPIMIILGALMDALRLDSYTRLMILMAVLGILGWAGIAHLVRGQILSLREQEFMIAAEATGIKTKDRIFRHLVPNVMPQLIVSATMGMGSTILMESTLSFLGLGVKHPLATWGTMINSVSSASAMAHYAYIWIPVGFLICLTVIAFNFVGDGLRDAYDPRSRR